MMMDLITYAKDQKTLPFDLRVESYDVLTAAAAAAKADPNNHYFTLVAVLDGTASDDILGT